MNKWIYLTFLAWTTLSFSQSSMDVLRPFFGFNGSDPMVMSIGNATVAAGQVIPLSASNPANWGLHRFSILKANFGHTQFGGNSSLLNRTGFTGLYGAIPIQVYQGSLVVGAGIHKEVDFYSNYIDNLSNFESLEEGGIYKTELGCSIEFAKNLFIGGELQYYRGKDELFHFYPDSTDYWHIKYNGISAAIGILSRVLPTIQFGASVQLPTYLWVDDSYTFSDKTNGDQSFSDNIDYRVKRPMIIHIGGSVLLKAFNIFYELEFADWQNLIFKSDEIYESDYELPASVEINREIRNNFTSTAAHHFGAALHVPFIPLHLYAGYQYLPVPFQDEYQSDKRESISAGFSFMIHQQVSIQGAFTEYFWKFKDGSDDFISEHFRQFSFGISLHY